jgi:hypothetical protein
MTAQSSESTLQKWIDRKDYLLGQEAIVSDFNQKYQLKKDIEECDKKIIEVEKLVELQKEELRKSEEEPENGNSDKSKFPSWYKEIITQFMYGNVVPFLGSGINPSLYIDLALSLEEKLRKDIVGGSISEKNLITAVIGLPCQFCPYLPMERPHESSLDRPQELVSVCPMLKGMELEDSCALYMEQKLATASMNLRYLSHYGKLKNGSNPFYSKLRQIITAAKNNNPNKLHQLFAELPRKMLAQGYPENQHGLPYPLIVTTNYDSLLEQAFDAVNQEYDVVYYIAEGADKGKFKHRGYKKNVGSLMTKDYLKKNPLPLIRPYEEISSQVYRPIILKLFGTVEDQFIVTQEQVHYFASRRIDDSLPDELLKLLRGPEKLSILFLGYNPSDPDLQLIVNRLWQDVQGSSSSSPSYLVHQSQPGELEQEIWKARGVELFNFDCSLEDFITSVQDGIEKEMIK